MSAHEQDAVPSPRAATGRGLDEAATPVLVVEAGEHRCGLPIEAVVELHRMVACVPLAQAPPLVDGIIDVRGTVVAVLDLRFRLGLARRPARPSDRLVVLRLDGRIVALRVDRVVDLVTVPVGRVEAGVGFPPEARLRGVARLDDGLLLVRDVEGFLSEDEAAALDDALARFADAGEGRP